MAPESGWWGVRAWPGGVVGLLGWPGAVGLVVLVGMFAACVVTLPWSMGTASGAQSARFNDGLTRLGRMPPFWWVYDEEDRARQNAGVSEEAIAEIADRFGVAAEEVRESADPQVKAALREHWVGFALGSDVLGRGLLTRCLAGGGISLGIGIAAALISVTIGTVYGAVAAQCGGRVDAVMMRIVDVLYGLPYILLVVLLAVASDAVLDEFVTQSRARQQWVVSEAREVEGGARLSRVEAIERLAEEPELRARLNAEAVERFSGQNISEGTRAFYDITILLVAIGGVSWLTMARVIRGQVLSLKAQPFVESARAIGVGPLRLLVRHLLPNLVAPIVVYATLTVPQAILQESFLSFLGIGVKPPLPSWGNLAAEGLGELNTHESNWWLLLFPCVLLAVTLLALNFVGEGLRESLDPKRTRRGGGV